MNITSERERNSSEFLSLFFFFSSFYNPFSFLFLFFFHVLFLQLVELEELVSGTQTYAGSDAVIFVVSLSLSFS